MRERTRQKRRGGRMRGIENSEGRGGREIEAS